MWTKLWQNFLTNPAVIDFIIEDIKQNADLSLDTFEIWPWKCALTRELVKIKPDLKVFEKDETLKKYLKECVKEENIIMGDFLEADISKYVKWEKFNAVWNLPYYITSPIFRKLVLVWGQMKNLDEVRWKVGCQEDAKKINQRGELSDNSLNNSQISMQYWIFMIQKEVWEKIKTDTKNKSMLWYLLNLNHKITYLKTVPPEDFSPPPKVDSCLVRFEYTGANPDIDPNRLFQILSLITPIKKKTLWKIQKILEKQWKKLEVPEDLKNKRIHELSYDEIKKIKI